jgi:gentisate 1,2-dioxygenase
MSDRHDAALISALEEVNFQPLWDRFQVLTPMNPDAKDKAFVWRWDDIEPLTVRAGKEVAMSDAERRAVIMCHPAFNGAIETTSNLISAFTVLEPGDKAPPHRHTAAAIRFATRCERAVTIVNGRRCEMHEGDLVLTPSMCWHGHINEGNERTTWFDAANMPLIAHLDANFFEPGGRDANDFWQVTQSTLNAMTTAEDGSKTLRYISPTSGGPVMPTLDCYYQRIANGQPTHKRRVTYNQICLVTNGEGCSKIGEDTIEWSRHDTFSIPHWAWASHKAADSDAEFFIVTDKSVYENLDLVREEIQN